MHQTEDGTHWIDVRRERLTGLTWPQLLVLCLLSGVIGAVVVFWRKLDEDWFPVVALVTATIVIGVSIGLARLAEAIWGKFDDLPKAR